eukprot:gene14209-10154_t
MAKVLRVLAFMAIVAFAHVAAVVAESYRLPEVRYADLLTLEPTVVADVARQLTDVGALQITGIPRFGLARKRALEDLAECLESEEEAPEVQLPDGARRLSCGASTSGNKGIAPMSSLCGDGAARLRNLVDAGMRQLFFALDSYAASRTAAGPLLDESYPTFSSLMEHGAHLEHLHAYVAPTAAPAAATTAAGAVSSPQKDAESSPATLGMHVDAGLFIGMTTGLYSRGFTAMKPPAGNDDDVVDCVNLLFESWTLDSRVKFGFACVGVFLLAALTQAVPLLRTACLRLPESHVRALALTVLFGVDKTVGYFVMLVAMTYSSELFAMICLGLTAGFVAFHLLSGEPERAKWGDACCDDDAVWGTANPVRGSRASGAAKATRGEGAPNCCAGTTQDI